MTHIKFPSIEQFNNVYHRETVLAPERRTLTLRAKIKLHGTNAGVRISPDGTVVAQSNRKDLTPDGDNGNFAQWLSSNASAWAKAAGTEVITFYGEWAGPGVAKGDAIQQTDKKRFFIFALGIGTEVHYNDEDKITSKWMITDPLSISSYLPEGLDMDEVRILPFEDEEPILFDFSDDAQISEALKFINDSVDGLDELDPYVWRTFDIKAPGEGFVLIPHSYAPGDLTAERYARLSFKTKTEKHRVRKQAKPASPKEPLPQTAIDFVETFCTPARIEQARQEICPGLPDIKKMGEMIIWMINDIQKEAGDEIAALPVEFSKVKPMIIATTRDWFQAQIRATYPAAAE